MQPCVDRGATARARDCTRDSQVGHDTLGDELVEVRCVDARATVGADVSATTKSIFFGLSDDMMSQIEEGAQAVARADTRMWHVSLAMISKTTQHFAELHVDGQTTSVRALRRRCDSCARLCLACRYGDANSRRNRPRPACTTRSPLVRLQVWSVRSRPVFNAVLVGEQVQTKLRDAAPIRSPENRGFRAAYGVTLLLFELLCTLWHPE